MTILTPVPAPVVRPVPWTRLAWVTWRRYRATLLGVLGILVVLGVDLVLTGAQARSSYAAAAACTPADSASCHFGWDTFHHTYAQTGLVGVILVFLPGIIGVFAGGPALARELETGTFRYAWTQGVGRMRWAVAVVVPGVLAAAAIVGAFGVLVSWHNQPLVDSGELQRLHTTVFPVTGIACAGWAMVGFGLGVLAGLLWRRVLPALVTAFAAWFGLAYLAAQLRVHYLAALTTTSLNLSNSDLTTGPVVHQRRPAGQRHPDQLRPGIHRRTDGRRPGKSPEAAWTPSNICSPTATNKSPATNRTAASGPTNGSSSAGSSPSPC